MYGSIITAKHSVAFRCNDEECSECEDGNCPNNYTRQFDLRPLLFRYETKQDVDYLMKLAKTKWLEENPTLLVQDIGRLTFWDDTAIEVK